MYGVGIEKLSEYLNIDNKQAYEILNKFTATFPGVKKFTHHVIQSCQEQGYLSSLSGRRRYFGNIQSQDFGLKGYARRQAVNFLIQGSAADICKAAMISTQRALYENNGLQDNDIRLLLQIHDELVWEVRGDIVNRVIGIIKHCMETLPGAWSTELSLSLPLPVKLSCGTNWGEMQPLD
uniref:DNA polymerase nu n=2 Tax=Cacopsylla melanoneura TaxID=428564 RepID=A0A8D8VL46_9HEMI